MIEKVTVSKPDIDGAPVLITLSVASDGKETSVRLPARAVGKLYAMLGKAQEFKSYDGTVRVEGEKVFSTEKIEKEIV